MTPTLLLILDGWGIAEPGPGHAPYIAATPNMDALMARCPHSQLTASGRDVGLPRGYMGNSEVGHLNIGAGRVVFQDLPRISKSIDDGDFFQNPAYVHAMDACKEKNEFRPLYDWKQPITARIESIAREVYGADGVEYESLATQRLKSLQERPDADNLGVCMVKTQYSLSDNPALKGVPKGWKLHVRDVLFFGGAGLVAPVAGDISLMPGTGSKPSFRNIDVDVETGKVTGLF